MLSITILPTIYSSLLNIDPTWTYKILYPPIFSFVPLILFKLWQRKLGSMKAFVASFLLVAQNTFYTEMLGLNRQMIGDLFFDLFYHFQLCINSIPLWTRRNFPDVFMPRSALFAHI